MPTSVEQGIGTWASLLEDEFGFDVGQLIYCFSCCSELQVDPPTPSGIAGFHT